MPYRFKFDESLKAGFRRIAGEQLDIVTRQLSAEPVPVTAIHESRKALKRLRALIRCCAHALGTKAARKHQVAIRDIARRMSSRRDSDVAGSTLAQLENDFGAEAMPTLAPLKAYISRQAQDAVLLDATERDEILLLLRGEMECLVRAPFKGRGYANAIAGIERHYRKGQKDLKAARSRPSDDAMHELRKSVQTHWRHMALLSRAWPDEFAARVTAARELSQMLGDDHDIAMLKTLASVLEKSERAPILKLCEQRQTEIRETVTHAARRLYAEPALSFGRRMTALWDEGRGIKSSAARTGLKVTSEVSQLTAVSSSTGNGSQEPLAAKTLATGGSQRRA
jgi:CHAD domain-containing protein